MCRECELEEQVGLAVAREKQTEAALAASQAEVARLRTILEWVKDRTDGSVFRYIHDEIEKQEVGRG